MTFDFSTIPTVWMYLFIFTLKFVEVAISTLRIVIVTKGEREKGAIIAFFEVMLWVFVVTLVLDDLMSDPLKIVIYGAAFASGNYVGSMLEEKLALGTINITAIVSAQEGRIIAKGMRDQGYALTVTPGEGRDGARHILNLHIHRKKITQTINALKELSPGVVITINDIRPIYGGYRGLRK